MATETGYVTDLEYIPGFYPHMAPVEISYCAALNGAKHPDPTKPYSYLELGCGLGRVFMTLAAANPQSRFVGVDFNATHIERAAAEIKTSGLQNATAIAADIRELPNDLGKFDYIAVHGVLSWVPEEVQKAILRAGQALLKPNGLLLVSYNILPGWAPLMPMRQLMIEYTKDTNTAPLDKIADALSYLEYIKNDAGYFKYNPVAVTHLNSLCTADPRYLVHEYLNECWTPFYFSDVHDRFRAHDMPFVGVMPPPKNYIDTVGSEKLRGLLESAESRRTRETHKDYFVGDLFRWDIYTTKSNEPCSELAASAPLLENVRYKTKNKTADIIKVKINDVEVVLDKPEQRRVLAACKNSQTQTELEKDSPAKKETIEAIAACVSFGAIRMQVEKEEENTAAESRNAKYELCNKFNAVVCERDAFNGRQTALASTVEGTGIPITDIEAGFIWLLTTNGIDKILDKAADELEKTKRVLQKNGQPVTSRKEIIYTLNHLYQAFTQKTLPRLIDGGVLTTKGN